MERIIANEISLIKHFFKPKDYAIEKEVRLLYKKDKTKNTTIKSCTKTDWFITDTYKILNKYIDFDIFSEDFPLKLKQVILGPKCPEKKINKKQLQYLLKESGFKDVLVTISEIRNYR